MKLHKMNIVNITKHKIGITKMRIVIFSIQFIALSNLHSFVLQNDPSPFLNSMHIYLSHSFNLFFLFLATLTLGPQYFANILRISHSCFSHFLIPSPRSWIHILCRCFKKAREKITQFLLSSNLSIRDYAQTSHSFMHFFIFWEIKWTINILNKNNILVSLDE